MPGEITLFQTKEDCCGCGACVDACPQRAIRMREDEYGFLYPEIDRLLCVPCGVCHEICGYQYVTYAGRAKEVYASVTKNDEILMRSASGGVFAAIAMNFLKRGGVVYGCSMERREQGLYPEHVRVDTVEKLPCLQGSKYVQSNMEGVYNRIKADLQEGRRVLFSGTPCQVSSLKRILGDEKRGNLFTMDLICHGVPSARFFNDYLEEIGKRRHARVVDIRFRDKTAGWGMRGSVVYIHRSGKRKRECIDRNLSSYFKLFLEANIYRESCYSCKFATNFRTGDITIGDFWGIQQGHPEYLHASGGGWREACGVSCVLVNSGRGKILLERYGDDLKLQPSQFEKVVNANAQLRKPSEIGRERRTVFELYKDGGYAAVEKWFGQRMGIKKYGYIIWLLLPLDIQNGLKKFVTIFKQWFRTVFT